MNRAPAPDLSLGADVGIAIGAALLLSLALLAIFYIRCYRRKRTRRRRLAPSVRSVEGAKGTVGASTSPSPGSRTRTRLGSVLSSVFTSKQRTRSQGGQLQELPQDDTSQHGPLSSAKELDELPSPTPELEGDLADKPGFGPEQARVLMQNPFDDASRQMDFHGPVPPYNHNNSSSSSAPQATDAIASQPSRIRSLDMNHLVLSTDAPPTAAWHGQRTGPSLALAIEPPVHSRSPSDAYSTYAGTSTSYGANTQSPYGYYAFNIPDDAPPIPSNTALHYGQDDSSHYETAQSLHSSNSKNPLLQHSSSVHSSDSPPSMTPTTPTGYPPEKQPLAEAQHSSSSLSNRRPPVIDKFEYLGSLPDNMPLPTPRQFQTEQSQHPEQQQQQPPNCGDGGNHSPTAAPQPVAFSQDPLLHVRPLHNHHQGPEDAQLSSSRRSSTDSLGSNFTVEEEARIQAQVVKNLAMLGKERVKGSNDLVHIPQVSNKRYSWEA